jgi:hypothetical protein
LVVVEVGFGCSGLGREGGFGSALGGVFFIGGFGFGLFDVQGFVSRITLPLLVTTGGSTVSITGFTFLTGFVSATFMIRLIFLRLLFGLGGGEKARATTGLLLPKISVSTSLSAVISDASDSEEYDADVKTRRFFPCRRRAGSLGGENARLVFTVLP